MFDEKLYQADPEFNLEKANNMKLCGLNEQNDELYRRFYNCLWYREDSYEPLSKEELLLGPSDEIIIVGHTPQGGIPVYKNINNSTIVYVDNSNSEEISGLILGSFEVIDLAKSLGQER